MSRFTETMKTLCDLLRSKTDITRKISLDEIPTIIKTIPEYYDYEALNEYLVGPVTFSNSEITTVRGYAFHWCQRLTTVDLPAVKTIGESAFYWCESLNTVNIPAVTNIGDYTFYWCPQLTTVDLPAVKTIGEAAFCECTGLTALIIRTSSVCTASSGVLDNTAIAGGFGYVYVPQALLSRYKSATNWSDYSDQFRAIEDYPDITGG